jgi:hypothetical protein
MGSEKKRDVKLDAAKRLDPPLGEPAVAGTMAARLQHVTQADMVQVAPGIWTPKGPGEVTELTLAHWVAQGDGTYRLTPYRDRLVRLCRRVASLLGFHGYYNTLFRLWWAGYIEIVKVAPGTHLINLDSYYNHLRRCAEDPEFWDDKARLEEYQRGFRRLDG